MEAFEHVVKVYLEGQGFIVTSNVKFPIERAGKNGVRQTTPYEVDIVAARGDSLILGFVKSFLGSRGVHRSGFKEIAGDGPRERDFGLYRVFNEADLRERIQEDAAARYGYRLEHVQIVLYVGKFASDKDKDVIDEYLRRIGAAVVGLREMVTDLLGQAESKTYINDPVIVTLKCLKELRLLAAANEEAA